MNLLLSTEIISPNNAKLLQSVANYCLKPTRALFGGRTVYLAAKDNSVLQNMPTYQTTSSWTRTAVAIATFIPAFIAGFLLRIGLSLSNSDLYAKIANEMSVKPKDIKDLSLEDAYARTRIQFVHLKNQMTSKAVWQEFEDCEKFSISSKL